MMPLDPDAPLLLADLPARAGLTLTAAGPGGTVVPCRDSPQRQAVYCAAGCVALSVPLVVWWEQGYWQAARALAAEFRRWGYQDVVEMRRAGG
jgi:hypothetical protein